MLLKWPCHFGSSLWTVVLQNLKPIFAFTHHSFFESWLPHPCRLPAPRRLLISHPGVLPVGAVTPSDVDVEMSGSDSEWIQIKDEAAMVHDQAVREEQETTPLLSEAQIIDSDDKPLSEKLREMEDALAKLTVSKEKKKLTFDDEAEVIEISPRKRVVKEEVTASTTGAFGPEGEVGSTASSHGPAGMEVEAAFGPEGEGHADTSSAMDAETIDPNVPITFVRQDSGLYAIKGFPDGLPHVDQATKKLARGVTNDDR